MLFLNPKNTTLKKVCCGDTKFCGECSLYNTMQDAPKSTAQSFTLNALGRCDFYRGPSEVTAHP